VVPDLLGRDSVGTHSEAEGLDGGPGGALSPPATSAPRRGKGCKVHAPTLPDLPVNQTVAGVGTAQHKLNELGLLGGVQKACYEAVP